MFDTNFKMSECAGKIIIKYIEDWLEANMDRSNKAEMKSCLIAWSPPEIDCIKLNVNGSLNLDLGTISA